MILPVVQEKPLDSVKKKEEFEANNTVILGVSRDSVQKHEKFCQKHQLTITLLSDEDPFITESYKVWQEKELWKNLYGYRSINIFNR